ncbi:MAG: glycosyl amidation-associated protein WbuZ [Candidatus Micrarchaeota archaeon]
MLKKRLIPCLLIKNKRCVKGVNFDNFIDTGHPVNTSRIYDNQGADELILLDISATNENREPIFEIIRSAADQCFMPITAGGGIKSVEDIKKMLLSGADKVAINTAAFYNPKLIEDGARAFGSQCIIVSIDFKKIDGKYIVFTHSGKKSTGVEVLDWAKKAVKLGAGELLLTSIDREGTRTGYELEIIKKVADEVDVPVIASGGVGNLDHLVQGINEGHASAVSLASILHFTDQSIIKAKAYMKNAGVDVRTFKWWK